MIALIEQEAPKGLSRAAMCRVLSVNRAALYRARRPPAPQDDVALRDAIQHIALELPGYGSRRITAELRRRGRRINRKRVQRLMREDNLLCLRRTKRVRTTDSRHALRVYPNLVPELELTGLNQLWVGDITYIRLLREFVYLAVLLDAHSRRCIGWSSLPGRHHDAKATGLCQRANAEPGSSSRPDVAKRGYQPQRPTTFAVCPHTPIVAAHHAKTGGSAFP